MGLIAIGVLIGIVLFVISTAMKAANSKGTEYLISTLQPLKGKHYDEIAGQIMKPTKRTNYTDGDYDCEWVTPSYQIVLRFNKNNICQGVVSESHENRG